MFFSPFIHDLCFPSPFIILLLLNLYALSYLLSFICGSEYIYCFIYIYYVLVYICCDYPLPVCFSTAKPEWLWRLM